MKIPLACGQIWETLDSLVTLRDFGLLVDLVDNLTFRALEHMVRFWRLRTLGRLHAHGVRRGSF